MDRMASELRLRVTLETAIAVVALAVPAAWLGGTPAAIGVLAAGLLTVGNFWWLSRAAFAAADAAKGRVLAGGWMFLTGARYILLFAAFAALCAAGYAHPVAIVIGLTILPCTLIYRGLRSARELP